MKTININFRSLFSLVVLLMAANSCDSFVEVDQPKSQLVSTIVFEDYGTATAALTDIYSKIRDKGILTGTNTGISNQLGNYTDEIIPYGTPSNPSLNFYTNSILPSTPAIAEYWNSAYNSIYAANSVIEGTHKSNALSIEQKNLLTGEALFIRAFLHFYLVNLYGDVPYIAQTDYRKNSTVTRDPVKTIYNNIISDLTESIAMLPASYSPTERSRPNKLVARALLARTYLFAGFFPEAANEASSLLNQTPLFSLEENTADVFLIASKETIWQLQSQTSGQNTQEAEVFIFQSGPPPLVALNNALVNSFADNDLRKSNWIKAVYDENSIWYHPYKYKEKNFTSVSKEYSIVFRLAEQYLIRAEARVQQGDLLGAKEDLNRIRHRAGLSDTYAVTKEEILEAILNERRWEFFTEQGHRFFDLKRFNKLDQQLSSLKPGWNPTDNLLPIPQSELSTNPNLRPQNPGY